MTATAKDIVSILWIATICSTAAGADAVLLRYRPEVGKKQTVQVTSHAASKPEASSGSHAAERHWILTLELEPQAVTIDGTVTMKVTVLRIRHKLCGVSEAGEFPMIDLDSAGEKPPYDYEVATCLAPIGESFTVIVSAQGRTTEVDTKAFCAAVARKRMQYEDEAIRREVTEDGGWRIRDVNAPTLRRSFPEVLEEATRKVNRKRGGVARYRPVQEKVEESIRRENNKYGGAAAQREQHYRNAAAESHLYSLGKLQWLFHDVAVPFPDEPVAVGGRWTAPFMMAADGPIELEATYTLVSRDGDTCTVQVEAQRTMEDETLMPPPIPEEHRTRLAGTYKGVMKIDRATGALLSKEASADLTGRTSTYIPPLPGMPKITTPAKIVPLALTATATVEPVR